MAQLTFRLLTITGEALTPQEVRSFELARSTDAACDGLRLSFFHPTALPELRCAEAYFEGEKVFFGYCDTQRETAFQDGVEAFIYARSSACLLTDNEALPQIYEAPSADALFLCNAKALGFTSRLPVIACKGAYQVSKGTSCFGAINDFVRGVTGRNILISPDNDICLPRGGETITLASDEILEEQRRINRGGVLTAIDYKAENDDAYRHHLKSRFAEEQGICRTRKQSLLALPEWQRDFTLLNQLQSSADGYYERLLTLRTLRLPPLYGTVHYRSTLDDAAEAYTISAVHAAFDARGTTTKITLSKPIDLKEIHYVA